MKVFIILQSAFTYVLLEIFSASIDPKSISSATPSVCVLAQLSGGMQYILV